MSAQATATQAYFTSTATTTFTNSLSTAYNAVTLGQGVSIVGSGSSITAPSVVGGGPNPYGMSAARYAMAEKLAFNDRVEIEQGEEIDILLPDKAVISVKKNGSYTIKDKDAQVTYAANRAREFNRYINASDLVEDFVRYLIGLGLSKAQILNIPIRSFIAFLIVRAAESDNEPQPKEELAMLHSLKLLPAPQKPRCADCGRYMNQKVHAMGYQLCNGDGCFSR